MGSLWLLIFMTAALFQGQLCYVTGPIAHLDSSLAPGSIPTLSLIDSGSAVGNQNSPVVRTPVVDQKPTVVRKPAVVNKPIISPAPAASASSDRNNSPVNFPKDVPVNPPRKPFPVMPVDAPKATSSGMAARPPKRPSQGLAYLPPPNQPQNAMKPPRRPNGGSHHQPTAPQQQQQQQRHRFFQDDYSGYYSIPPVFPPSVSYQHSYQETSHPGVFFPSQHYPNHNIYKRQIGRPQSGPFFNNGPPRQNGFNNNGFGGNWGNGNQNRPNFNQGQPPQPWWNNGGFNSNSEESEEPPFIFSQTTPRPGRPSPVARPRPPPGRPAPTQPTPTPAPLAEFTDEATVPTAGTTRRGCTCPTTPEFNPVCGDDRVTYFNAGRLRCANQCGNRVSFIHGGACITSTTSAPTTPSILNQRRRQG